MENIQLVTMLDTMLDRAVAETGATIEEATQSGLAYLVGQLLQVLGVHDAIAYLEDLISGAWEVVSSSPILSALAMCSDESTLTLH